VCRRRFPGSLTRALAAALLALGLAACDSPRVERLGGHTMGTTYEVVVTQPPRGVERADLQRVVDEVLADIDRHLSNWNPHSEISRFNAGNGTDWVPASAMLLRLLSTTQSVSRATDGAFDVTVAPLVRAWGFGTNATERVASPSDADLERLRRSVGYRKLELREAPPALRKVDPELHVDLDGVAPGLAVDLIAERLERLGAGNYLVELGGEVRARGRSHSGRPWRIAVEAPLPGERRPFAIVELDGRAVSTSGDYRDFREVDGRRVSHTIDPRSGTPVTHGLTSVTVIHSSAAEADAWATALMVLGPESGLALAEQNGLAALFIRRADDDSLHETSSRAFPAFRRPL
jgi:thiamine biosynthesis lipoprotein